MSKFFHLKQVSLETWKLTWKHFDKVISGHTHHHVCPIGGLSMSNFPTLTLQIKKPCATIFPCTDKYVEISTIIPTVLINNLPPCGPWLKSSSYHWTQHLLWVKYYARCSGDHSVTKSKARFFSKEEAEVIKLGMLWWRTKLFPTGEKRRPMMADLHRMAGSWQQRSLKCCLDLSA